jgi:hypothetical protein
VEVIAVRRLGVIVALGALLSMFKGAGAACLHTRHSPRREWSLMIGTAVTRQLTGRARLVLIILAALIGFGAPALTAPAASAATTPVYTFTVADLGQGVHEGGELLSDGSISGGGELSIFNGTVIASITGVDWQQADPDAVTMCFDFQFQKPAVFSKIECLTVPVGGPTKVQLAGIAETLVRVTPVGAGG